MSAFMIPCPCCHAVFPLEAALNDLAARQAIVEAFKLTPFGDLLLAYINLFKPPKRVLSMTRIVKLLEELMPLIRAAKIERGGRIWSAPQDYWKQALEEMQGKRDTLTLPLKSHGYLLTIIQGYSSKAEAKAEATREGQRAGHTPIGGYPHPNPPPRGEGTNAKVAKPSTPRKAMPQHVKAVLNKNASEKLMSGHPKENDDGQ